MVTNLRRIVAVLMVSTVSACAVFSRPEAPEGNDELPELSPYQTARLESEKREAEAAWRPVDAPAPAPAPAPVTVTAPPPMAAASAGKYDARPEPLAEYAPAPREEAAKPSPSKKAMLREAASTGLGALGAKGGGVGGGGALAYGIGGGVSYGVGSASIGSASGRGAMMKIPSGPRGSIAFAPAQPVEGDDDRISNSEGYATYGVNPFVDAKVDHLSTFSIDVDTASYTIARRKLVEGVMPPRDSVRVEEFLNYFKYAYESPETEPFSVHMDAAPSPFEPGRHLVRVGVQGRRLKLSERKPAHLTFLVDVSGSMQSPDKLPLAQKAMRIAVDSLRDGDTVALVTYAGGVREVLAPTGLEQKAKIHEAIESLTAGGSTAMSSGIELAYANAAKGLTADSTSRVVILSDGDANVGPTGHDEILKLIAKHLKEGVFLSVVGFGMGNYKDDRMEQFADKGNGNYSYVDGLFQARRVFQEQLGSTLEVIAQDVKIQMDWNPEYVTRYRLIGYENRDIADRDFRNDKVDAGEIGSGHSVTALYEVELNAAALSAGASAKLATVRVRAKQPRGTTASEWAFPFDGAKLSPTFEAASQDLRFATAVMAAAEVFRQSPHARTWRIEDIQKIARNASPAGNAERQEFLRLLERSASVVGSVASR